MIELPDPPLVDKTIESPDPLLVDEQAALPAYAERPAPQGCLGWLAKLWGLVSGFIGLAQPESVQVLLPPPPGTYGYATLFTPHPKVIQRSREALKSYRAAYEQDPARPEDYPWHVVVARHTGLPCLLRGLWDDQGPSDPPVNIDDISEWLLQDLRARALFGIEPADARQRLKYTDTNLVHIHRESQQDEKDGRTLVHARYRQMHRDWPVFGGQVVAHLASRNRRTSVTSSYFPLDASVEFAAEIDPATAIAVAQQALAGYLDDLQAIGLYQAMLRSWLKAQAVDQPAAGQWRRVHARVAHKMISGLAVYSKQHGHVFEDLEQLVAGGLPATRGRLVRLLGQLGERLEKHGPGEWQVRVIPYAGSDHFVFPFAGSYHLAYQIELLSADQTQAWRVFVDAETGDVLGRPETCVLQTRYYATAADLLKTPPVSSDYLPSLTANPCKDFMAVGIYKAGGDPSQDLPPQWSHNQPSGRDFEGTNVAIHAKEMYDHFVGTCGADAGKLNTSPLGLRARVFKESPDPALAMGFNHAPSLQPKLIIFQTDNHNGLVAENEKLVHHPSYDPEVIYHELTHGLQWLLNPHPFDDLITSVPFGRALVEGYANYFGRSLAARVDDDEDLQRWARAAFRDEPDWNDRWALKRDKQVDGEDRLPAPNMYPPNKSTQGLDVYDVGMVWARALWDLRSSATIGLNPDDVDRLALDAYNYVHGWVASFEQAAEGVIHAAAEAGIALDEDAAHSLFAARGILAHQSIQALVRAGGVVLAGADAGLMRSTNSGEDNTWIDWDVLQAQNGTKLTDVVALAIDGGTFYAATETGIYQRASSDSSDGWAPVEDWPANQTPFCLAVANGVIYVGTGHGVWFCNLNGAARKWAVFECPHSTNGTLCIDCPVPPEQCYHNHLGLGLALAPIPSGTDGTDGTVGTVGLCTAIFDAVRYRRVSPNAPWWTEFIPDSANRAAVVAVATGGAVAYLGTLDRGIFRRENEDSPWTSIASWAELGNSAVLHMAIHDGKVLAGTTRGLYVGALGGDATWSWTPRPAGFPDNGVVTRVLPIDDQIILASTATDGLLRLRKNQPWEIVQGVNNLTGP